MAVLDCKCSFMFRLAPPRTNSRMGNMLNDLYAHHIVGVIPQIRSLSFSYKFQENLTTIIRDVPAIVEFLEQIGNDVSVIALHSQVNGRIALCIPNVGSSAFLKCINSFIFLQLASFSEEQ